MSVTPITDAHCAKCECAQTPCECAAKLRAIETELTAACERNGNLSVELATILKYNRELSERFDSLALKMSGDARYAMEKAARMVRHYGRAI